MDDENIRNMKNNFLKGFDQIARKKIVFVDTNILTNFPNSDMLNSLLEGNVLNNFKFSRDSFNHLSEYFEGLSSYIKDYETIMTVPEVIDESSRLVLIFRNKMKFLMKIGNMMGNQVITRSDTSISQEDINFLYGFCRTSKQSLSLRIKILEDRLLNFEGEYASFFDGSFFPRDSVRYGKYELLKKLVNSLYNTYNHKGVQIKLCADDALVAAAFLIMDNCNSPLAIVSNDFGVLDRVGMLNSMFYNLGEGVDEIYEKMNSIGISTYRFDKEGRSFVHQETADGGLRYKLNGFYKEKQRFNLMVKEYVTV